MIGSLAGDIIGSVYEFNNIKTKDFPLFSKESFYTDDSIMTIAVADWLLHGGDLVRVMQYKFDESCQGTVPEALIAFLESRSFEDAIRLAVSLGGDSDTLACITGGIAEAFYRYRIPYGIRSKVLSLLDDDLRRIVKEFIDARREWFIHPRWEEDGESISIVVSEPSKEEVEKLKTESVRLILNSLNSETDEKKE